MAFLARDYWKSVFWPLFFAQKRGLEPRKWLDVITNAQYVSWWMWNIHTNMLNYNCLHFFDVFRTLLTKMCILTSFFGLNGDLCPGKNQTFFLHHEVHSNWYDSRLPNVAWHYSARFIGKVCDLRCFLWEKVRGFRKSMLSLLKMKSWCRNYRLAKNSAILQRSAQKLHF